MSKLPKFQEASKGKLKRRLQNRNLWSRMKSGKLTAVEQSALPAEKTPGGTSYIISYYDENSEYLFTIHRIVDNDGRTIVHEHVKDALIDGVRYKAREKQRAP